MSTLALKLILTPLLMSGASLAGRRWGTAVSGWLVGLPLTSGPVMLFLALDHGADFAERAAEGIILSIISVALFCLAYARLSDRLGWVGAALTGWLAYFAATLALREVGATLVPAFVCAVSVLALVLWLLPRAEEVAANAKPPAWDLPARVLIATGSVLLLTASAGWLGSRLSGLLATAPIFITTLAVFTHRAHGAAAAASLLRGVIAGAFSFPVFFLTVALMLGDHGVLASFACATAAALTLHRLALRFIGRAPKPVEQSPPCEEEDGHDD